MCLGDFTSRKTRRMQIRVLSEFNFKLAFRNKSTYSRWIRLVFGILQNARPGEFLKLLVQKGTLQLACLVITQGGCSFCPPKHSHKYARTQFWSQAITFFRSGLLRIGNCGEISHRLQSVFTHVASIYANLLEQNKKKRTISLHRVIDSITSRSGRP